MDNQHSPLPFGTIDTPAEGGSASGSGYINFGWVVTPQPNIIATDGSTITVSIDGQAVGHPVYNNYRSDIASLFPGLRNSNGAVGYFSINTTQYAAGRHSMYWLVTDSAGNAQGIGSRYFAVPEQTSAMDHPGMTEVQHNQANPYYCEGDQYTLHASNSISRQSGNQSVASASTYVTGPSPNYWVGHVDTVYKENGQVLFTLTDQAAAGSTASRQFTSTFFSNGVYHLGPYEIISTHYAINEVCLGQGVVYNPFNANTKGTFSSVLPTIIKPARPDYAPGQPRALWYLGQQQGQSILMDGAYQAQTALTPGAANGAPESPGYVITAGSTKMSLSCTNCTSPTATARAASGGCQNYDVLVQTSYGGLLSEPMFIFINRPWNLIAGRDVAPEANGAWVWSVPKDNGYLTRVNYNTYGLCATEDALTDYHVNEQFAGSIVPDYPGWNWPSSANAGSTYVESGHTQWADNIQISNTGLAAGDPAYCAGGLCVPQFCNPGVTCADGVSFHTLVDHIPQSWYIGSPTSGSGLRVQTNTLQNYTDSGWHTDIVSPNP